MATGSALRLDKTSRFVTWARSSLRALGAAETELGPLEGAYRQRFLADDVRQVQGLLPLYALAIAVYGVIDYQLHGWSLWLFVLLSVRGVFLAGSWFVYHRLQRIGTFEAMDRLLLQWALAVYALALFVNYVRSTTIFYNAAIDVLLVMLAYLIVPNKLVFRAVPAFAFSCLQISLWVFLQSGANQAVMRSNILALLIANALGFLLSVRLYAFRRAQFLARHQEQLARAEIERLAATDALTGVANRRCWFELAEYEFRAFKLEARACSVLYLDVDHFKRINDTLGHAVGDEVLRHLCTLIGASLRPSDKLGRLGGEEFAVLLPATTLETAAMLAERFRATCAETPLSGAGLSVTLSIGVAQADSSDVNVDQLMHRADTALYDAKRSGRDRVQLAS